MLESEICTKLEEAWRNSTPSNNLFAEAISSVKWDDAFEEDGELYYCKGGMTIIACDPNPFADVFRNPVVIFSDASEHEFHVS